MIGLDDILKLLTPVAIAAAWVWAQMRMSKKDIEQHKATIADREIAYSERLEKRLKTAHVELENALRLIETRQNPEEVLREVVEKDPGVMFVKKRIAPKLYHYLKVSRGYATLYLGGPSAIIENKTESLILGWDFSEADELIYLSQEGATIHERIESSLTKIKGTFVGRKFPLHFAGADYIIGVGDHEFNQET